jgi:hypothetical protein
MKTAVGFSNTGNMSVSKGAVKIKYFHIREHKILLYQLEPPISSP